ncbi:hypothetical protein DJ84_18345 [Halorubrum ezzemoulense]|nr:hypothetical protein DJ84_18345 [Halorubrum ezzemoulense]
MTDDDQKEKMRERMRSRFDDPAVDQEEENTDGTGERDATDSTQSEKSKRSTPEKTSKNAKNERNSMRAKNVKESWSATSVYLPEFLDRQLTTTYKHADLEFEEEFGRSLQKTRYYYPLLVALGMERIEEMGAQELQERIEDLEADAGEE